MNISDFEKEVNPTTLKRGQKYFNEQAVADLEETSKGKWSATVHGNNDYIVHINLNNRQRIADVDCECPLPN